MYSGSQVQGCKVSRLGYFRMFHVGIMSKHSHCFGQTSASAFAETISSALFRHCGLVIPGQEASAVAQNALQ